jgi:molybdenum cofactor cytidylyltransferase
LDTVLVTGAHHEEILEKTNLKAYHIQYNERWEEGMGTSLGCGIGYVLKRFDSATAILVLLSDQPLVSADFLKQMISLSREHPGKIIASGYGDAAGVPALFPDMFWPSLGQVPPEQGARRFIRDQRNNTVILEPGVATTDIDTPAAYLRALEVAGLKTNLE